jgi:hypothetical protein
MTRIDHMTGRTTGPRRNRATAALFSLLALSVGAIPAEAGTPSRTVLVIVCLADNVHQGIVPVPERLGNGDDPAHNLYWGARFGLKTFFSASTSWTFVESGKPDDRRILERCLFRRKTGDVRLVAEAYAGRAIRDAVKRFMSVISGDDRTLIGTAGPGPGAKPITGSDADLVVYVGHNGLMDFELDEAFPARDARSREAMVFACHSRSYFSEGLRRAKASPVLWTAGLMAPEAYSLEAALEGWVAGEAAERIRERAAAAYARYQKVSLKAAGKIFVAGW